MGLKEKDNLPKRKNIAISLLKPSEFQPRYSFDEEAIDALKKSIGNHGVLQPLLVKKSKDASYDIVAGERRYRAARAAGLKRVPCTVMDVVDEEALIVALVENIQREDLNPIEEARAYKNLQEKLGLNQEQLSQKVGKDRASVANTLRLLKLPKAIQDFVVKGSLTMGHARALLSLENNFDMMLMLAKKVSREDLSVRKTEALARAIKRGSGMSGNAIAKSSSKTHLSTMEQEVLRKIEYALGTRVWLKKEGKSYALGIYLDDIEGLNGILEKLGISI